MQKIATFRKNEWVWVLLLLAAAATFFWFTQLRGKPEHFLRAGAEQQFDLVTDHPQLVVHGIPNRSGVITGSRFESTSGRPEASLNADFYDFGSIASTAVVEHKFYIANQGSAPLSIRNAYTTCGCTTAKLSASVIPPGKAAQVTVIFDAGFHRASGSTVRRGLVLETNDPDYPQMEIWVQARVR